MEKVTQLYYLLAVTALEKLIRSETASNTEKEESGTELKNSVPYSFLLEGVLPTIFFQNGLI